MRVVIDTNVIISSFFGGNPRKVVELWKQHAITLCLSNDILDEYTAILQSMNLSEEKLAGLLHLLAKGFNMIFTTKTPDLHVVKDDPDDDKFVECAVKLNADIIVTGDKALLKIKKYGNVSVLTPKEFLEKFFTVKTGTLPTFL